MPQTPIFPSMLGTACSGQVQPEMGEQCGDPVYQDGCLVSGSLEALIERLVPTVDYYPDVSSLLLCVGYCFFVVSYFMCLLCVNVLIKHCALAWLVQARVTLSFCCILVHDWYFCSI